MFQICILEQRQGGGYREERQNPKAQEGQAGPITAEPSEAMLVLIVVFGLHCPTPAPSPPFPVSVSYKFTSLLSKAQIQSHTNGGGFHPLGRLRRLKIVPKSS